MSNTMRIKLTQPWGDYEAGKELVPETNLAMRLISAGVAVPIHEPAQTEGIDTSMLEQAPEQTVQPRTRRGRRRKPK